VFDHTSTLKFLEKRFGVMEPNISDWRRAVSGDLTSCFDFKTPNASPVTLPSTDDYTQRLAHAARQPDLKIPAVQTPAEQPRAQRPARPLPYRLGADLRPNGEDLLIDLANTGAHAAVFTIHDYAPYGLNAPWHYTLVPGERHTAAHWNHRDKEAYDLAVHGPNGFYRHFRGRPSKDGYIRVALREDPAAGKVVLTLRNNAAAEATLSLSVDPRYPVAAGAARQQTIVLKGGEMREVTLDLAASDLWYDISLSNAADADFLWRYAGHVETGKPSRTDPGIGPMVLTL
jgi:phospholipase C